MSFIQRKLLFAASSNTSHGSTVNLQSGFAAQPKVVTVRFNEKGFSRYPRIEATIAWASLEGLSKVQSKVVNVRYGENRGLRYHPLPGNNTVTRLSSKVCYLAQSMMDFLVNVVHGDNWC